MAGYSKLHRLSWLAALAFLFTGSGAYAARYAVLVGIGEYRPASWRLLAPANDLALMQDACRRWGIPAPNVSVLRDLSATKSAVLNALRRAGQAAQSGDMLTFYFTGHAVLVADIYGPHPGDERQHQPPDGDDEALVVADSRPRDPMSFLLDDELADVLEPLQRKGVHIVCIFDCCFAYDGIRAGGEELGAMKTIREEAPEDDSPVTGTVKAYRASVPGVLDFKGPLLVAAAGPRQTIREVYWSMGQLKIPMSPLTLGIWAMAAQSQDWTDLLTRLQAFHTRRRFTWQPATQGNGTWRSCLPLSSGGTLAMRDKNHKYYSVKCDALVGLVR